MTEKEKAAPVEEAAEAAPKKGDKKKPAAEKRKKACTVRCDYCRMEHTTIYEPCSQGSTIMAMHENKAIDTDIPLEHMIRGNAICPGCGTPVPIRTRVDGSNCFLARQCIH